jgi:hypothetical protein
MSLLSKPGSKARCVKHIVWLFGQPSVKLGRRREDCRSVDWCSDSARKAIERTWELPCCACLLVLVLMLTCLESCWFLYVNHATLKKCEQQQQQQQQQNKSGGRCVRPGFWKSNLLDDTRKRWRDDLMEERKRKMVSRKFEWSSGRDGRRSEKEVEGVGSNRYHHRNFESACL